MINFFAERNVICSKEGETHMDIDISDVYKVVPSLKDEKCVHECIINECRLNSCTSISVLRFPSFRRSSGILLSCSSGHFVCGHLVSSNSCTTHDAWEKLFHRFCYSLYFLIFNFPHLTFRRLVGE
jgi:hypothetical protein